MSSNPIFIDVATSTPAPVKRELGESPRETDMSLLLARDRKETSIPDGSTTESGTQKRYKCGMCDYSTCHSTLFNEHNNRHKGVKPYKCSLCPYHSVSKQYIKVHELRHSGRSRLARRCRGAGEGADGGDGGGRQGGSEGTCTSCGKGFTKRWLETHIANKQSCPHCQFTSCSGLMKGHLVTAHGVATTASARKDKFMCALCLFSGSSDHKILLHLIHHPQATDCVDVTVLVDCGILPGKSARTPGGVFRHREFDNWCYLFMSNMCDYPGHEYAVVQAGSCEEYLKSRRMFVYSGIKIPTQAPAGRAETSADDGDTNTNKSEHTPKALRSETMTTAFSTLYAYHIAFDNHYCPLRCPETYDPVCVSANRNFGKYFKMWTFLNHCKGDLYYCLHPDEFAPPEGEEYEKVKSSYLGWSYCGSYRYMQFSRFAEVTAAMEHYGWLQGDYRYTHIMEPHERRPGYG